MFVDNLIHPLHSGNHCGKPRRSKRHEHSMAKFVTGYTFLKRSPGMGPHTTF
jgi:hypothetical protein